MTLTSPRSGPCSPWITAADVLKLPRCGNADEDLAAQVALAASGILFILSGNQFTGECGPVIVRPVARPVDQDTRRAGSLSPLGYMSGGSFLAYGLVLANTAAAYGSVNAPVVELNPYPVTEIVEVTIDGVTIPADEYELQNYRSLVRMRPVPSFTPTERWGWPTSQIMDLPLTEEGTFGVTFNFGILPPAEGLLAVKALAKNLCLASMGQPNQLPERLTNISRQGVTATVLDQADIIGKGRTGIPEVDLFVKTQNPYGLVKPAVVWSPDIGRAQRVPQ